MASGLGGGPRALLALACLVFTAGCSQAPRPEARVGFPKTPERPLIFVPGILGTKLENSSGRSAWGSGLDVLWPRDGGYEMALSLVDPGADDLQLHGIVDAVRLGPLYQRRVYSRMFEWFEQRGYRAGDLDRPDVDDRADLFGFAYDFRRSNEAAADALRERLEELRRARGGELEYDLLCQSNGAYICRLLVARESRRSDGHPPLVPTRFALVGTANGGGLRVLRELRDGRVYVPTLGLGRKFQPEVIFSFESVFVDLPHAAMVAPRGPDPLFLDEQGEPLQIDLYDASAWRQFGWSVFAPAVRERLDESRAAPLFGTEADRLTYLQERLARARRLQEELRRGPAPFDSPPELLMVQAQHIPTIVTAVLVQDDDGVWSTIFLGDPAAAELDPAVRERLAVDGDEHATLASQLWLSAAEASWIDEPVLFVEGGHFDMILLPEVLDRLAAFFLAGSAPVADGKAKPAGPR